VSLVVKRRMNEIPELEAYATVARRTMVASASRIDAIKQMRDAVAEVSQQLRCEPDLVCEWCDYHLFAARYDAS
jgi:hypothetical protein